jgi:hypothetical protein
MKQLAPALEVPVEELASMVAGGEWAGASYEAFSVSAPRLAMAARSTGSPSSGSDKVLLSLERRLRDVPPLERIALLNQLIAQAVNELAEGAVGT